MLDRERVEQGIKACWSKYFFHKCCDCPYMSDRNDRKCVERLGADALALLKKQEPIVGRWISTPYKKARICSICHADEPYKFADDDADIYDFCPHCGAKMEGL